MASYDQPSFDRYIEHAPPEWRGPLTEVIDTAGAIRRALDDFDIDSPELLLGLTKLVLERQDAQNQAEATASNLNF